MKTLFFLAVIHLFCAGNTASVDQKRNTAQINNNTLVTKYADTTTLNGKWYLQPLLASDTATGKLPVLEINLPAAKFSGNTGCNNMRGSFQKTDTSLVFNPNIITTKMLCTGYNEAAFIKSLLHTNTYKLEKDVLILLFDATELSRWTRKPGGPVRSNKA